MRRFRAVGDPDGPFAALALAFTGRSTPTDSGTALTLTALP